MTQNIRSLLQNKDFEAQFVSRFLDRLNYTFDSSNIIPRIDEMAGVILPELPRHWERWNLTQKRWQKEVDRMKEFSKKRPAFMRDFLRARFPKYGKDVELRIDVDSNGVVELNQVIPISGKFRGIYFDKLPASLKAKPYFDCVFSHWEVDGERIEGKDLAFRFSDTLHHIKAIFKKGKHPASQQMIINEISISDTSSGDWLEFYNDTDESLDISQWQIASLGKKVFVFPEGTSIEPKDYIVVCKNQTKFQAAFPTCKNYLGGLPFGLSQEKESIMLYDREDNPVDSVGYAFHKDSVGKAQTLVLRDFTLDNDFIENWNKLQRSGSPASINPDYVQLKKIKEWNQFLEYIKIGGITTVIFVIIVMAYIMVRKQLRQKQ